MGVQAAAALVGQLFAPRFALMPKTPTPDPLHDQPQPGDMLRLARYTLPVHIALAPAGLWLSKIHPAIIDDIWLFLHLAFPVVLILYRRRWRGLGEELTVLIVLNHVATLFAGWFLVNFS